MKGDDLKKRSGAELRALRDQRQREQGGPYAGQEASRREASFLSNLSGARDDYEWIVANQAWTKLGHESYTAWYLARVQPLMQALGARPTPELAADVVQRVREEEAVLPAAQRRTQRELAELAGVHQSSVSRSAPDANACGSDLEEPAEDPAPAPEFVSTPVGPSTKAFAEALDRLVPNPDPHAEWRLGFLKRVHAVHAVMRSTPEDVAGKADETCLDELRRCAEAMEDYRVAVNRAVAANLPDNVSPIRRVS